MKEKKKIIIIGPGTPYRNGQAVFLAHLCHKLDSEFNVELLNFTMLYPTFLFPGTTQYDNSDDKKLVFPNKRMLSSLNPFTWIKVAKYINKAKPDIVGIDWWHPFFGLCCYGITSLLSKEMKKKVLFITENVISHEANKSDVILTKLGLKHAQCFLALSNSVEQHLKKMFSKKVFKSALPFYDFYQNETTATQQSLRTQFGYEEKNIVFLFFGLVRKYKGLDILLKAFVPIAKAYPEARLLVAGEFYEDEKPYFDIVKAQGLSNVVTIENKYVANEKVADYFNVSDCIVMPYRSATQSGILSIAYGFHKPVIVTDVGELSALVKNKITGLITAPNSEKDFADSMIEYIKMKETTDFKTNIENHLQEIDEFAAINEVFTDIDAYLNRN